ncbi:MAG: SOS response-associated peptidase family protein, partial [Chloroflexi bacterium]|nr:SOS response-associated peptidase family protein [Chloroflexota bacterium]
LFATWQNRETGEVIRSCAIITTGPNALMEPIHDRMPVILDAEAEALWLDPATDDPVRLVSLLRPYPAEEMEAYPVSTVVNSAREDRPEMVEPI